MYGYAKCHFCRRRFSLRYKEDWIGEKVPDNFVILSKPDRKLIYAHKTCYSKYKKAKVKRIKYTLSLGLKTGVANAQAGMDIE